MNTLQQLPPWAVIVCAIITAVGGLGGLVAVIGMKINSRRQIVGRDGAAGDGNLFQQFGAIPGGGEPPCTRGREHGDMIRENHDDLREIKGLMARFVTAYEQQTQILAGIKESQKETTALMRTILRLVEQLLSGGKVWRYSDDGNGPVIPAVEGEHR